ncbi:CheR family methyltransferase [Nakamurella leprariae]|uniref:protein-glutamate O-methyltransferase n=1 Tax=Nakamurella leprariae TaxID=2803911 RepID=A0A939C0C9_9ACTN|nr:CheR family methyltransferase [Nakamurella leprariae]MBM9465894.1 PAS domain-containing protein [Nakamurella leprariae]
MTGPDGEHPTPADDVTVTDPFQDRDGAAGASTDGAVHPDDSTHGDPVGGTAGGPDGDDDLDAGDAADWTLSERSSSPRRVRTQPAPLDPAFERLVVYLKEVRGFDFTGYKRPSLMRRVTHQMHQVGITGYEEYYDYLQVHPDEFTALFNTILINVTAFFRDVDAWEAMRTEVLPELIDREATRPIRVWSAACASGQEAYSLAIVLAEYLGMEQFRSRVKIYATDVDEGALSLARHAVYGERDLGGVPEDLLAKYFERSGSRWAFRKDLRRNVIFGRNDLVQDAPISRIDLLACRNALMYFNAETQSRIVSRLAFALNPRGVLFLGKAEMLLNHADAFEPIDLKRRFFRRQATLTRRETPPEAATPQPQRAVTPLHDIDLLRSQAFQTSPVAQLVLGPHDQVELVNYRAAGLLGVSERDVGRPFQDLDVSFRPAELRSHLAEVRQTRRVTWLREVEWHRSPGERVFLDIQLVPLTDLRGRWLGVSLLFNDVSRFRQLQLELESSNRALETAYEELQSTNEELETTNEELQSTVEELETTNEELQSTNEELETMNEELQSMNDELQATNEQLRDRTGEITSLNDFMESVLGSLGAGVVVVDRDLLVQVWNGQTEELWGLREDETVGQHLLNLDSGLPVDRIKPLIRAVTSEGAARRDELMHAVNRRGRSVTLRVQVMPLLAGDEPQGALILMSPEEPEEAREPQDLR